MREVGFGIYDPSRFWPDSGCTLAVTAITGRNQNASGSDPACLLGTLHLLSRHLLSAVPWISEEIQRSILCPRNTPVNMPDPIRKRFCYVQLWPLRPECSQNRAEQYMPDPTSRIRFSSVFFFFLTKKAWVILCKTDPDLIWMAWSWFGETHLVRK